MIALVKRLFARGEPALSEATPRDAGAIARLHALSFRRGWSDGEFERLLLERNTVAHRATVGATFAGFILSRLVTDEAEIDRKSTRLNSSHSRASRMPSSA